MIPGGLVTAPRAPPLCHVLRHPGTACRRLPRRPIYLHCPRCHPPRPHLPMTTIGGDTSASSSQRASTATSTSTTRETTSFYRNQRSRTTGPTAPARTVAYADTAAQGSSSRATMHTAHYGSTGPAVACRAPVSSTGQSMVPTQNGPTYESSNRRRHLLLHQGLRRRHHRHLRATSTVDRMKASCSAAL